MKRRALLATGLAISVVPAWATPETMAGAIQVFTGGRPAQPGKVRLDIAPLVDNGNTVPVTVTVDQPMDGPNPVTAIALFNEKNPQHDVGVFTLGPRIGRAEVSTRIRLATSQKIVALARLADGSCWSQTVDVVVTLAACIE